MKDLEALRALANESARRAISTHAHRKHRKTAVTKVIVATLAGVTSLWLMLQSPDWRDPQFMTACVLMLVAAYWAGETYQALLDSLRDAAYGGTEDELDDLDGSLDMPPAESTSGKGSQELRRRNARAFSEPAFGAHVVEVAQVVVDADVVEHAAQAAEGDAHAVGPAEAAELAAAFEMRLQVEDHARDAALGELLARAAESPRRSRAGSARGRCRPGRPARSA